ncbi:hypothetical protein ACRE_051450 [Hapsidospora chrysogenum ATCC 11550]|uniref:Uncharacterized protein n=1 Tax=Hapsidospora chrysogenum (strain ATCC 11550 / CBS 779.69 / DSM 880 / IAM 14645 / JCM 23072 / IMI 49137) TaxID=857340 RepID=A0A086T3Y6_HAPC1|nr:hypothetical protein ACRE_051450 [Hapsidospora chrysogenum ATCC 11550]
MPDYYNYPPRRQRDGLNADYYRDAQPRDDYNRRSRHHNPVGHRGRADRDHGHGPVAASRNHRTHHSPERRPHRSSRAGHHPDYYDHQRRRSPDSSPHRHPRTRNHGGRHQPEPRRRTRAVTNTRPDDRLHHAAKAAIDAAAVEAIRVRRQPGEWAGQKGVRVATAALGAVAADRARHKFSDDDGKDKHSGRHLIESAVGGLVANRLLNGSRKQDLGRRRRRRR